MRDIPLSFPYTYPYIYTVGAVVSGESGDAGRKIVVNYTLTFENRGGMIIIGGTERFRRSIVKHSFSYGIIPCAFLLSEYN